MTVSQTSVHAVPGNTGASPTPGDRPATSRREIRRILGLSVPLTVVLAERDISIESIISIRVGTIIEFSVPFDLDLTLHVANRPIGRGQAVKVGENFGLRISAIEDVHGRIEAMGGHSRSS